MLGFVSFDGGGQLFNQSFHSATCLDGGVKGYRWEDLAESFQIGVEKLRQISKLRRRFVRVNGWFTIQNHGAKAGNAGALISRARRDSWLPFDLEEPDFHVTAEVKTLGSDNKPLSREGAGMAA